ncbi:serine protease inhibitor swm-1-like [Plodia interpunctella]|uniref:serine protease inhibitor swm-1-like n=1 Tax=Plodia interpunctella TaxID=58824 RepID=UPI002368D2ED|nr:serine protease inhibitor swm-1-like [Plodia interpunctella]
MSIREDFVIIFFGLVALTAGVFITKDECPPNEEYLLCGSACPFNCTDPKGPVTCSDDCVEGCFCKAGFLRNENGTCVNADQCIGDKNPVCGTNEEFLSCGTACPGTCSNPDPLVCGLACSMGCFCKSGYVRDETSNSCVTLDKCPAEQCFNQNEVYDICNANCEASCADPEPICTKLCQGGCVCASGLLRSESGDCVSVDKCPKSNSTEPGLLGKYLNVINKIIHLSSVNGSS